MVEQHSGGSDDLISRRIHLSVRTAILAGAFVAGTVIGVKALAKRYGAGRRAVASALSQLEEEGLVRRTGDDSVVVADPAPSPLGDLDEATALWRRRTGTPEATPGSDFP